MSRTSRAGFQLLVSLLLLVGGGSLVGCGSSDNFVFTNSNNNNVTGRNVTVDVNLPTALPQGGDFLVRLRLQALPSATTIFSAEQEGSFGQQLRFVIPDVANGTFNVRVDLVDGNGTVVSTSIQRISVQGNIVEFDVPGSSFGPPLPEGAIEPTGPEPDPDPDPNPNAPVAVDDSYNTLNATAITRDAAQGVTANDSSDNGTVALVTPPASGTLALNADGSFTYTPAGTFSGAVSFVYRLTDANGSDTATATINVATPGGELPPDLIFVQAGATGTGESQGSPRGDLLGALDDASSGTVVFILDSASPISLQSETTAEGRTDASFFIPSGVSVIGEGTGLTNPSIPSGTRPLVEGNFDVGNNTRLSGIELTGKNRFGQDDACVRRGSGNVVGVRVDNCLLRAPNQFGFFFTTVAGDLTIEDNIFAGATTTLGGPFNIFLSNSNADVVIDDNVQDKAGIIQVGGAGNNPTVTFTNNQSEADSFNPQGLSIFITNGAKPVVELAGNNMVCDSPTFDIENFTFNIGNSSVEASIHDNTMENGRVFVSSLGNFSSESIIDAFENEGVGCQFNYGGSTQGRVRWQSNLTLVGIEANGLSSSDVNASVDGTARLRALFQDNTHEFGASLSTGGAGQLDVAVVNNQFGNPDSMAGGFRLRFLVQALGNGDMICMKGSGTTVGSNYAFAEGDTSQFLIENLSAFISGITTGGNPDFDSLDPDIGNAAPGTCQTPDPLTLP